MVAQPTRSESLRQISIVIDSLDRATADELLQHLSAEQQRAIRDQMVELQHVSPAEKQLVMTAFCESLRRGGPAVAVAEACPLCHRRAKSPAN